MEEGDFQFLVVSLLCRLKDSLKGTPETSSRPRRPLPRLGNLEDFETFIQELEDPNLFDECVESLVRLIGGADIKGIVKGMMNHLMTNQVMAQFSMTGRKGLKPAFEGLTMATLITTAALRAAEKAGISATGTEVKNCIREHLRYAAFRK